MACFSGPNTPLPDPDSTPVHVFEMTNSQTPQTEDVDVMAINTSGISK